MPLGGDHQRLPRYSANALLVWKGRDWNKVADMLESWRALPGRNCEGQVTPAGTFIHSAPGGLDALEPLQAYITGGEVRVVPGYIRNPYTVPQIDGTAIDDDEPPGLTPASGTSYLYLKVDFDPQTVELDTGYYAMGFGVDVINSAEFILDASLSPSGAADPVIDSSDGSVTTAGVAYIFWGEVENDSGEISLVYDTGRGHATLLFHPPDQLLVLQS